MSEEKRLTSLLSKGYFPKELPPVFTTADFGKHAREIIEDWRLNKVFKTSDIKKRILLKNRRMRGSYTYELPDADIEVISKPKRGYERRNINVTHPIPQALLSYEISFHWRSIQKWLVRQYYSLDEIQISDQYERSIKGINFSLHRAKKGFLEATSDWLVKTDITRFYPSIYTHSISWAAYGKERVKRELKNYKGSLADRLDILVRCCNRNQTIGIPIGPETSRIIAEVISARIDSDFTEVNQNLAREKVDRLQDDWFIGVDTLEEAETVLSRITSIYRAYGLDINGYKTSIEHILATSGTSWISEIGAFLSHGHRSLSGNRLKEFLSLSLRLQSEFPADSVINYSLSVIEGRNFGYSDIEALESFLLKATVLSPLSMDKICRIILNIQHDSGKLSSERIRERFTTLAERNLEKGNLYEAIWLIYALRGLKEKLVSKKISGMIGAVPGSTLQLILLDMKDRDCFPYSLPISEWEDQITDERVMSDWIWLLAYEGIRKGWLRDRNNVLRKPFFHSMATRNIVFYDPKRNVPRSGKVVSMRKKYQQAQSRELTRIMLGLRGFDIAQHIEVYE